jgi:hypothetical protein
MNVEPVRDAAAGADLVLLGMVGLLDVGDLGDLVVTAMVGVQGRGREEDGLNGP